MVLGSLLLVAILPILCIAQNQNCGQSIDYDLNRGYKEQNGKTKSSNSGLDWLSKYMLPVPKSAYHPKQVAYHSSEQNSFNELL